MVRPLRIEYPGAIHHVMSRGNLRRSVFEDERDYLRLLQGLEQTVGRFGWDLHRALLGSRLLRDEIEAIRHRFPKTGPNPAKPAPVACWLRSGSGR